MAGSRSLPITARRGAVLAIAWVAVVIVAGPPLRLYYATFATWAALPPLALVYAYWASHRSRATVIAAVVATAAAVFVIGVAVLIPEGTAV